MDKIFFIAFVLIGSGFAAPLGSEGKNLNLKKL